MQLPRGGEQCTGNGLCTSGLACIKNVCIALLEDEVFEPEPQPAPEPPLASWAEHSGEDSFGTWASVYVSGVKLKFRWIEPGTFWMGSPDDDEEAYDWEKPRHQVRLTEGYWMAETEVTQQLWQAVMGGNPSFFTGETRPVETVSWDDVQAFLSALNTEVPGLEARLPTEAQWEYAARAGTEPPRYGPLDEVAWHSGNSPNTTQPVGTKAPNAWGLYDTLGNVYEWCQDDYDDHEARAISGTTIEDPTGPVDGRGRVVRGGSWGYDAQDVRAAYRYECGPAFGNSHFGLRLSRGP
ncbi:MAG: formylglycine-generating enzyme family protein [Myxococcales bacterium]|nr:formylglycine-generating enzyme family protein [Myxococcales bacterium]